MNVLQQMSEWPSASAKKNKTSELPSLSQNSWAVQHLAERTFRFLFEAVSFLKSLQMS